MAACIRGSETYLLLSDRYTLPFNELAANWCESGVYDKTLLVKVLALFPVVFCVTLVVSSVHTDEHCIDDK